MSPSHARKRGIKYRYYLSSVLLEGRPDHSGSIQRVPAVEIEALVIRSVREHLKLAGPTDEKDLVTTHVERVEVQPDGVSRVSYPLEPVTGWASTQSSELGRQARRLLGG